MNRVVYLAMRLQFRRFILFWLLVGSASAIGQPGQDEIIGRLAQTPANQLKRVIDVERSSSGVISYVIRNDQTGEVLAKAASSYQPDPKEAVNWATGHSLSAQAYWNATADLVAIDEAAHRYEGTVLIVMIPKGGPAKELEIPEAGLLKAIGAKWDRYRFSCQGGWIGPRELALTLVAQRDYRTERVPIQVTIQRSGKITWGKPGSVY